MTYAAPKDIRFAAAPDGSVSGSCGELDDEQLQAHIQSAQDLVDAYTSVPFYDTNVPGVIKDLVIALSTFYATLAYRKGKELLPTNPVYLRYMDAQRTLTNIKAGIINFEPPQLDTDSPPVRRKPKINNAWRSAADLFPMDNFGMKVESGNANEGYRVTDDPEMNNSGFA